MSSFVVDVFYHQASLNVNHRIITYPFVNLHHHPKSLHIVTASLFNDTLDFRLITVFNFHRFGSRIKDTGKLRHRITCPIRKNNDIVLSRFNHSRKGYRITCISTLNPSITIHLLHKQKHSQPYRFVLLHSICIYRPLLQYKRYLFMCIYLQRSYYCLFPLYLQRFLRLLLTLLNTVMKTSFIFDILAKT